jgi:hypothetical protein
MTKISMLKDQNYYIGLKIDKLKEEKEPTKTK